MFIKQEEIKLFFDEPNHKYTDSLGNPYTSMTTVIDKYKIPFDKQYWARKKAREYGTTVSKVLRNWDDITDYSLDKGSSKHNNLENATKQTSKFIDAVRRLSDRKEGQMFTVYDISFDNDYGKVDVKEFSRMLGGKYPRIVAMIEWLTSCGYRLYAEVGVFNFELLISGMIDLLAIRDDGHFIICDWKTNKDTIHFTSGYYVKDKKTRQTTNEWVSQDKRMLAPLSNLQDCKGIGYQLQLSGYAWLTHKCLNFIYDGLFLCHIQDQYILNKWNMPLKDDKGFHVIDKEKDEIVTIYNLNVLYTDVERMFRHHYETYTKPNRNTQSKLMFG